MARTSTSVALILLVIIPLPGPAYAGDFMAKADVEVDPAYIKLLVQGALRGVLGNGHDVEPLRLAAINATVSPIFDALAKNERGLLSAGSMRYAVQRYFSQSHGWMIKGFDPYTSNKANDALTNLTIMHGQVPGYVESIIEKNLQHGGFDAQDVMVVVATIETLIFNENMKGLDASYAVNGLNQSSFLENRNEMIEMMISYFIIEHLQADSTSYKQHKFDKDNIGRFYQHWYDMRAFIADTAGDFEWLHEQNRNPFVTHAAYSYEELTRATRHFSEHYGPFSNHECFAMKMRLAEMDVHNTGRVRLTDFYRLSLDKSKQQEFLETEEYLSLIGALDTSSLTVGPQVIIPNYILGPNNCISSSTYYDVCCLNECDAMYMHLEAKIRLPFASAAEIQAALEGGITLAPVLSSSSPTEARNLSAPLLARLQQISVYHNDRIPLHGRLFAQWLHYAYPRECPFPQKTGFFDVEKMDNLKKTYKHIVPSDEDLEKLAAAGPALDALDEASLSLMPYAGDAMWTMEEELLEHVVPNQSGIHVASLRFAAHVLILVTVGGMIGNEALRLLRSQSRAKNAKKEDDLGSSMSYYI